MNKNKLKNISKVQKSLVLDTYELAYNCLRDEKRTSLFKKAIHEIVNDGDVVLDVGTGTGILSLFASENSPKQIYSMEISPYMFKVASRVINENNIKSNIDIIYGNGIELSRMECGQMIDVAILELMATGLISEMQVPVFNSLIENKVINPSTEIIPMRYITFAQLAFIDYKIEGYQFKIIQHEQQWFKSKIKKLLTDKLEVATIDFYAATKDMQEINLVVEKYLDFYVNNEGTMNGLIITGLAELAPNVILDRTLYLNNPIIVPLKEKSVRKGSRIRIMIKYLMGGGIENLKIKEY